MLNFIFLAGTTLVLIFLTLSGATNHFPFNTFYWVRGDTSAISGAPVQSAWTFWGVCDYNDFGSCTSGPAFPISPVDNFGTTVNVPSDFVTNRNTFYYLTRFSFAFLLLGLAFAGFAFFIVIVGFCFSVVDKVVAGLVVFALFFISATASLQTAANVLAKNAFTNDGLSAHIGVKSMALLWTAEACLLIAFFNTCAANIAQSYRKHIERVHGNKEAEEEYYAPPPGDQVSGPVGDESSFTRAAPAEKEDTGSGGIRFFRIKRNQKPSDEESV